MKRGRNFHSENGPKTAFDLRCAFHCDPLARQKQVLLHRKSKGQFGVDPTTVMAIATKRWMQDAAYAKWLGNNKADRAK